MQVLSRRRYSPGPAPDRLSIDLFARLKRGLRLGGDTHTVDDVLDAIRDGRMHSFTHNNAWVITEIIQTPRRRFLNVFLVVGDNLEDVMAIQPEMVQFARTHGCEWVQTLGRIGWDAVLPQHGWKPTHRLYTLELDESDG